MLHVLFFNRKLKNHPFDSFYFHVLFVSSTNVIICNFRITVRSFFRNQTLTVLVERRIGFFFKAAVFRKTFVSEPFLFFASA